MKYMSMYIQRFMDPTSQSRSAETAVAKVASPFPWLITLITITGSQVVRYSSISA